MEHRTLHNLSVSNTDYNQHYVSQFVLRGFHTGNEGQIWVFDKLKCKSFTDAIKNVASEHGFYNIAGSAEIDEVIQKTEDATAPIVEEIRTRKSLKGLDEHKRIWLSGFTALQLVRTKGYSERAQDMMRQITNVVTHLSSGKLSNKIRKQLGLNIPASGHEKTLATILGLARSAVEELLKKMLVLCQSDGSSVFWIGDSPVPLQNSINPRDGLRSNLGLGVPGIEVYLPISKDLVLAHMCPSIAVVAAALDEEARGMGFIHARARPYLQALHNGTPMVLDRQEIHDQNMLQLAYAERFVYSPMNNFQDALKILEENPRFKTGPRMGMASPMSQDPTS